MIRIEKIKTVLKLLTVEPFLFFIYLATIAKQDTYAQFYQDKVCLVSRQLSNEICSTVATSRDPMYLEDKKAIVNEANLIGVYQAITQNVPGIIYAIMLSPWADKVKGARRQLMIAIALGHILDSTVGIISVIYEETLPPWTAVAISLPSALAGGNLAVTISTLGYASLTTPTVHMPLRFILMDIVQKAVRPLSAVVCGRLVSSPSWIPNKVRNFTGVYTLCLLSGIFALVWTLTMIDNSDWKARPEESNVAEKYKFFNKENVLQLKTTLTRMRDNLGHFQLWLLLVINSFSIMAAQGPSSIRLPFVQLVYGWNIGNLQDMSALFTALTLIIYAVGSPILTNWLKFSIPELAIFGLSGTCLYVVSFGTILSKYGYYVANIFGSFGSVNGASVKAKMAAIVDKTEKSSAFALLAISTNLSSSVARWYHQRVFRETLDTMPGLGIQSGSLLILMAMSGWIWIDFHAIKTSKAVDCVEAVDDVQTTKL
ncbi:hypothetical protein HDE_01720 [Halotydeus destructor]|nr:hypothetical protein HDE_01720 [Halotydeus destructor]